VTNSYVGSELNTEVHTNHPSFTLYILTPSRSTSSGCFPPWEVATLRDFLEFLGTQLSRLSFTSNIHGVAIDLHVLFRELAINPPVISFSGLRDFDWGPVTVPIQVDGRAQSQRTNLNCSYLETAVWFLFEDSGLIAQYDVTFRRLAWANDYTKSFIKPLLVEELGSLVDNCDDVDDLMHLRAAIDVCREHELHCLGPNQQYNSTQACIDYIYRKTPMGKVYEWGGNSGESYFLCRHPALTKPPCVHSHV